MELLAAQEWGLIPSEFWSKTEQDQAYMIAFVRDRSMMQAWEEQEHARKLDPARDGSSPPKVRKKRR